MKNANVVLTGGLAVLLASPALAGVTIRRSVQSSGVHGAGAFKAQSTLEFDGLKAQKTRTLKFTGSVLSFFSGKGGKTTMEIDRVDLDKRWALNPKSKTYTESPISLPPQKSGAQDQSAPAASESASRQPSVRIVKTEFHVKDAGEKKQVGDFSAEHYAVDYLLETQDARSGQTQTYRMKADVWAAPWTKDLKLAADEQAAYNKAYLEKLGLGVSPEAGQDFGFKLLALMTGAGGKSLSQSEPEFEAKMARIKGYPVALDVRWYPVQDSAQSSQVQADQPSQDSGADLSGGASQVATNFLGGLAAKMARREIEKKEAGGQQPVFSVRTTVESVAVGSLPKSDFEVPAGYRKKS
ncbi:MAG TPA: hypothetical protein VNK24_08760 [Elusimicrobiota bacterium]|nr:hypothetical protein [Elusimicrobiota bacterium]